MEVQIADAVALVGRHARERARYTKFSIDYVMPSNIEVNGGTITYTTSDFTLAVSHGHVLIEGRTVWHSNGATFVLHFTPSPWWRRGFKVRELP